MQLPQTPLDEPVVQVPIMVATELQDSLLVVMRDLQRLESLLDHATTNLLARFSEASSLLARAVEASQNAEAQQAQAVLHSAITELQFHDMSTQLIWHTTQVLQSCAFRLAAETMEPDDEELDIPATPLMPERPNPVTQSEMDAGSIELF